MAPVNDRPSGRVRLAAVAAVVIVLAALPWVLPPYHTILLSYGLAFAVAALGFNLLLGYAGLLTTTSTSTSTTSSSSTSTSLATTTSSTTTTSTSSSVTSTSSSTTTVTTTTTSTTVPPTCLEEPLDGFDAVDCALGFLQEIVVAEPDEVLGGKKIARRLRGKLSKADGLVEKARASGKPEKILGKARRKVVSFDTQIGKLIEGGKLDPTLGGDLLDLSTELTVRIDGVLMAITN